MADYVNPFGGYAQGYGQGAQLEDQLQQDARRARQEDWESRYMNPIALDTARRTNELGAYRLPYEKEATNDASIQSRAGAENARLDTATRYALALRDPSLLNSAGESAIGSTYVPANAQTLLRGADFERNAAIANATANMQEKQALAGYYQGRDPTTIEAAQIRANPGTAAPPGPAQRLFPTVPTSPTVAPGAIPEQPANEESPGVNPQGSALTPFHQLDPIAQAHVMHYTSQLTGHPIDAVAAHISNQYNPAPQGTDSNATTNFTTA
jgi:hypothetical protein